VAVPKLAVGPLEAGRLLGERPLQEQDRLLVAAPALPVGQLFEALFQRIGNAFQGDRGYGRRVCFERRSLWYRTGGTAVAPGSSPRVQGYRLSLYQDEGVRTWGCGGKLGLP
jgi:hypothetical protein